MGHAERIKWCIESTQVQVKYRPCARVAIAVAVKVRKKRMEGQELSKLTILLLIFLALVSGTPSCLWFMSIDFVKLIWRGKKGKNI